MFPSRFDFVAAHSVDEAVTAKSQGGGETRILAGGQSLLPMMKIRLANPEKLIDINNIHVNSVNHGYDAEAFLKAIPDERIVYAHIAGHYVEAPDFLVDTHGATIIDPVWSLLDLAYERFGVFPTLLERDFNIPPLSELMLEVETIRSIQSLHTPQRRHA